MKTPALKLLLSRSGGLSAYRTLITRAAFLRRLVTEHLTRANSEQ
jgi:hypothetical protein